MSDKSDWIDWGGGECPVAPDALVECWLRDECEEEAMSVQAAAKYWKWQHHDDGDGIIKYRIVGESK